MMRTANPALNANTFTKYDQTEYAATTMSIQGVVNRTALLLILAMVSASWTWSLASDLENIGQAGPWIIGGAIGGFIFAIITIFAKKYAAFTAPIYALLQGLFLGGISAIFEVRFPGIVIQAVGLTFGTLFCLLFAYTSRLIKATENFKLGVFAATGGIFFVYLASFVMGFFGSGIGFIHSSGPIGIAFSLFVVVIAALNLVLDFDFIERGAKQGAPKYLEWYAAFGLMVTLVWLYIEILRLLSKLRSRR